MVEGFIALVGLLALVAAIVGMLRPGWVLPKRFAKRSFVLLVYLPLFMMVGWLVPSPPPEPKPAKIESSTKPKVDFSMEAEALGMARRFLRRDMKPLKIDFPWLGHEVTRLESDVFLVTGTWEAVVRGTAIEEHYAIKIRRVETPAGVKWYPMGE